MRRRLDVMLFLSLVLIITTVPFKGWAKKKAQPNVLLIMVDDINDWIGPLKGNSQAKTPYLDQFCNEAMIFPNATCAAPLCGPSRSAILSGYMPSTSGVYGNAHNMFYSTKVKENATLPEYFTKHGYYTLSNGKIFHKHGSKQGTDFGHWAFDEHARARRYVSNNPDPKTVTTCGGSINGKKDPSFKSKAKLRWGPTKCDLEGMVDYKVAQWGDEKLNQEWNKPFFMALGFIKPHLSWYVPKKYFDMYDLNTIKVPEVFSTDLDDILTPEGEKAFKPTKEYLWVKEHGLEKEATQAYLANISFVDDCLGVVFDALEKSGQKENTIVMIMGDHGYHLGEKQRYLKNTTWCEAVKTPFIVRLPNMKEPLVCDRTVNLIDVYPTLVNLCNLPQKELDGRDISALLRKPKAKWDRPGITVTNVGTSVMGERYHFSQQLDGTEEFYDLENDPMEWENLITNPKYKDQIDEMRSWVPKERVKPHNVHYKKQKNYVDAESDPTLKPQRDLNKLK